jgi:hypothetical protein
VCGSHVCGPDLCEKGEAGLSLLRSNVGVVRGRGVQVYSLPGWDGFTDSGSLEGCRR